MSVDSRANSAKNRRRSSRRRRPRSADVTRAAHERALSTFDRDAGRRPATRDQYAARLARPDDARSSARTSSAASRRSFARPRAPSELLSEGTRRATHAALPVAALRSASTR